MKNIRADLTGLTAGTNNTLNVAVAQDSATLAVPQDVTRQSKIYRIWCEIWVQASADVAVGTTIAYEAYLMKNPGVNLTVPTPGTVGTSNEKKFVFKIWKGLLVAHTVGMGYTWRGWIKIPKVYQRMGSNDAIQFVSLSTGTNAIQCTNFIYKWFT